MIIMVFVTFFWRSFQDPFAFLSAYGVLIIAALGLLAISLLYRGSLSKAAGQRNQGLFGMSMTGAAGFAKIASERLGQDYESGIWYITRSLRCLDKYFIDRGQVIPTVADVMASLESLQDYLKILPHTPVERLANGLARLPDMQELQPIMTGFLREIGWAGTVETIRKPKRSSYEALLLIAAFLAGLGAILPETYRQGLFSSLGSSPALEIAIILAIGYVTVRNIGQTGLGAVNPHILMMYKTSLES